MFQRYHHERKMELTSKACRVICIELRFLNCKGVIEAYFSREKKQGNNS